MEHEEDSFIDREVLLGAMRQAARMRKDRLIPWETVYEIIMNCPTREQELASITSQSEAIAK